jgi:hypothetical protein
LKEICIHSNRRSQGRFVSGGGGPDTPRDDDDDEEEEDEDDFDDDDVPAPSRSILQLPDPLPLHQ